MMEIQTRLIWEPTTSIMLKRLNRQPRQGAWNKNKERACCSSRRTVISDFQAISSLPEALFLSFPFVCQYSDKIYTRKKIGLHSEQIRGHSYLALLWLSGTRTLQNNSLKQLFSITFFIGSRQITQMQSQGYFFNFYNLYCVL